MVATPQRRSGSLALVEVLIGAHAGEDRESWRERLSQVLRLRAEVGVVVHARSRLLTRQICELALSEGSEGGRMWTTDLTVEYVRLNADYHT